MSISCSGECRITTNLKTQCPTTGSVYFLSIRLCQFIQAGLRWVWSELQVGPRGSSSHPF